MAKLDLYAHMVATTVDKGDHFYPTGHALIRSHGSDCDAYIMVSDNQSPHQTAIGNNSRKIDIVLDIY